MRPISFHLAIAGSLMLGSHAASSDEWICTLANSTDRTPMVMTTAGDVMIEQPLGIPRYRILQNSDAVLVAEDHYNDYDPVLNARLLFVTTVMIDKTSSLLTMTIVMSGAGVLQHNGHCRRFAAEVAGTR